MVAKISWLYYPLHLEWVKQLLRKKFNKNISHLKYKNLKLIKIYLITDNKEELKKRLIKRNQNSKKEVQRRFNSFDEDIKHWNDYDYIVINKNLEVCFRQIENIILSNKNPISIFPHTT